MVTGESMGDSCWVITESREPYRIVSASDSWYVTWGFDQDEAVGSSIRILNGSDGHGHDSLGAHMVMRLRCVKCARCFEE